MTLTTAHTTGTDAGSAPRAVPVDPSSGVLRPLGLDDVTITGGLWARRQHVNGTATLDHVESWLEREGWIRNFDLATSGGLPSGRRGREFADSEVYKYLEALAWEIRRTGDSPRLEERFRSIVDRVAAAQEPDGYLNTRFGRPGQGDRWSDLEWGHELYCLGHLFQAAVARHRTQATADDGLVAVAVRAADLVCDVFGPDGLQRVCGHAEVEVGLAELGRALGNDRYVEQARLFVERHGHQSLADVEWSRGYFQDDVTVLETDALHGHAVRANYLASGAVDVATETGDTDLLRSLSDQWRRTIDRRTYVTGGQGSHHQDEAFGQDWELPPDRAYSETCAGIGSVMFSWRLLLAQGGSEYADQIERTLFNVVETSPSDDGRSFYYANTLHQRTPGAEADPETISPRAHSSLRAPWFEVSCCPPNTARTFASLAAYVATTTDHGLQIHQYADASIRTVLGDGQHVAVDVATSWPDDGDVVVTVLEDSADGWTLSLRRPAWATDARVSVHRADGQAAQAETAVSAGELQVSRTFRAGDRVVASFGTTPRLTEPDPRVDAVRGCVAVERGPVVHALESTDLRGTALEGATFADLRIDVAEPLVDLEDGVAATLQDRVTGDRAVVALVPYHRWALRGPSEMRVWIPVL